LNSEIMKNIVKELIRAEKGQVLLLALILLSVGALIITPLLGLMSTGLIAGQMYENKMYEQYAADAGIEDAQQRLLNDDWVPSYNLTDPINNKQVEVYIDAVWLLAGLPGSLDLPNSQPSETNPRYGNDEWTVIGAINIENTTNYIIDITASANYPNAGDVKVGHIGVWLPQGYSYVNGSTKINGVAVGENSLVTNPGNITHKGGTVLIWDYTGKNTTFKKLSDISLSPPGGCTPAKKFPLSLRLSFDYATAKESQMAKGFFSWMKLADVDRHVAWDAEFGIFHITSRAASNLATEAGTKIDTYTLRSFRRYYPGTGGTASSVRGDYIAIGNSLMTSAWKNRYGSSCNDYVYTNPVTDPNYTGAYYVDTCRQIRGSLWQESSATVNANAVPADARIEKAYLYWTAYQKNSKNADEEVTLKVNGMPVGTGGAVTADTSYVLEVPQVGGWQYFCFADVTSQVKAITTQVNNTNFTVGGVSATSATAAGRNAEGWNEYANAGWSMIIIYSSPEKETRQIYLYHDRPFALQYTNVGFNVTGFEAPEVLEGDMEAKLAVFVAEGDPHYKSDYLKFQGAQSIDFHFLGDAQETNPNPYNNVFNGYSTAIGFAPSALLGQTAGTISGCDIDVYTTDKDNIPLSNIVKPGDTSATIGLETDIDYIMLVYVVFSVRSTAALGEGFDIGTMTYKIG
jgi:hypothetical protein